MSTRGTPTGSPSSAFGHTCDDDAVQQLCDGFAAEADDLDRIVASPDVDWSTSTPAPGWSVADQISHLWFFDQRAAMALADPDAFRADAEALMVAMVESGGTDMSAAAGRSMTSASLLDAWRLDRTRLIELARDVDPSTRVPWYGPAMGARSFVTARVMETWSHGQDIADALGVTRRPTDRLRHVAHIGVGARAFSYAVHGRPMPDAAIRVELRAPSGDVWTWGPDDAVDRVAGDAVEFCLVVTQRRHLDDMSLAVSGHAATEWMSIAQSFAGPPGPGRAPGQFA